MQSFSKKKVPPLHTFWKRHHALFSYLFSVVKVSSLTFVVQTMAFETKLANQCGKVTQYGYKIFQTVLSLNCKII